MRALLPVVVVVGLLHPARGTSQSVADVRLGPGDGVRVEIAAEPSLSGEYWVDVTGMVLVPLLGLVPAGGRPFAELEREIREGLARELTDAVRVTPLLRVAVLGEVRLPGLYAVDPTMALPDVLARAGGLLPSAREDDIRIVGPAGDRRTAIDDVSIEPLRSGDQILVGRRSWLSQNGPLFVGAGASVLAALVTSLIVR